MPSQQGVIVANALLYIYNIHYIPSFELPTSVRLVISDNVPDSSTRIHI